MGFLDHFKRVVDAVGIFRAVIALFSAGIAHNIAFVFQFPRSLLSLIDGAFLANITLQFSVVLSAALVLIILINHASAVTYGMALGLLVSRLEKKRKGQLHPLKKRERYFDLVRRKIDKAAAPILVGAKWALPPAILGYYYAGGFALISLPIIVLIFSVSVPVLYPNLNFDIQFTEADQSKVSNAGFWAAFFSDTSTVQQLTTFIASVLILLSAYLGFVRHSYLVRTASFVVVQQQQERTLSIVGSTSQAIVAYDASTDLYSLVLWGSVSDLKPLLD